MPKTVIGALYCVFIVFQIIVGVNFSNAWTLHSSELNQIQGYQNDLLQAQANGNQYGASNAQGGLQETEQQMQNDQPAFLWAIILMCMPGIFFLIPWIGTLVNLGRAGSWTWFLLTFFFGGIAVLIYLFAGPGTPKKPITATPSPATPQYASVSGPSPQAPRQLSALEILQQRFALGEIDSATFQQMSELLRASERRSER